MGQRDLTSGMQTAVGASALTPIMFYEGEFTGGTIRLVSGPAEQTWNGQTWYPTGQFLGFSEVSETTEIRASGTRVSLNAAAPALLAAALAQARSGYAGRVWLGGLDSAGALIVDPYLTMEGRLDVPDLVWGAPASITLSYESRLIDLERPRVRRITHEDQLAEFPGDLGRQHLPDMQDKTLVW